jgi:hypothetical protein
MGANDTRFPAFARGAVRLGQFLGLLGSGRGGKSDTAEGRIQRALMVCGRAGGHSASVYSGVQHLTHRETLK